MGMLSHRIKRHLRKRKKKRWHIDYLLEEAGRLKAYPIIANTRLECSIAALLREGGFDSVPNFGSSDCSCPSHLFHSRTYPFHIPKFRDYFFRLRHRLCFQ